MSDTGPRSTPPGLLGIALVRSGHHPVVGVVIGLLFICPMVLTYWHRARVRTAPTLILLGMLLANAILIVQDVADDPTNHNLWPFEFVGILLLSIPAYLGAALSRALGRPRKE